VALKIAYQPGFLLTYEQASNILLKISVNLALIKSDKLPHFQYHTPLVSVLITVTCQVHVSRLSCVLSIVGSGCETIHFSCDLQGKLLMMEMSSVRESH
jgi:hypothetical protein